MPGRQQQRAFIKTHSNGTPQDVRSCTTLKQLNNRIHETGKTV